MNNRLQLKKAIGRTIYRILFILLIPFRFCLLFILKSKQHNEARTDAIRFSYNYSD
ncbi:MAG: hypothetical protein JXA54_14220 [Candidatus Heimdallarchaeota archaeon]|nr:hypothetical protein [Candidatus Heimdallarchaeota archaeon]